MPTLPCTSFRSRSSSKPPQTGSAVPGLLAPRVRIHPRARAGTGTINSKKSGKPYFIKDDPEAMARIYGRADSERRLLDLYPRRVRKVGDIARVEAEMQEELKAGARGLLARIRKWNLKRQYKKFEKNADDPFHAGADGENKVLERLSRLGDQYHVLCGVRISLPYFISYDGKKNLKSAQVDFVVVSRKGVYAIEVKNWSDRYVIGGDYFSPHEQAARASRLLWHVLKSWRREPRVTGVVLSIKGNIRYDPKYAMVFVANVGNINNLLEGRRDTLSEKDVDRIVGKLKGSVTT